MSAPTSIPDDETGFDRVLAFTLPARNARGRMVRLGPVLDTVLAAHEYPTAIRHLLAEALVLTALLGSLLKDSTDQMTIQAQADGGIVDLLVCDFRGGEVRGYVRHDPERLASLGVFPDLRTLLGDGYLAITYDLAATGQRYQGIVPLQSGSLTSACEAYFAQSEQIPTLIRTSVRWNGHHCIAGGLLVQHLAEGEDGRERLHVRFDHPEWEHVAILGGSLREDELVSPDLSLEAIIWRLYHEEREIRVERLAPLTRGCRCTIEHYQSVLKRFPEGERAEMRDADGTIPVDCAFCSRQFRVDA